MEKILVTGANGMLGLAIEKEFTDYELLLTDKDEFDVTRRTKDIFDFKPDYLFHLAAETNLELCETHPKFAYYTNTIGTMNMIQLAKSLDIPIVYISTAGVFSGREESDENSIPSPINIYGKSKYCGELVVRPYPKHYIFRMSWAFGGGSRDKKFVMKICKQISAGKSSIEAIDTHCGSPTYTKDVAEVIHSFIKEKKPYGLYHIPTGRATRYEVACEIVKILESMTPVYKAKEKQFIDYVAKRPKCEVLTSVKLVEVRNWKEALKEYLDKLCQEKQ